MSEPSKEIIEELRESYQKMGPVRKVVKTQFGIASGNTRKKAVPEWPETYKQVKDYYEHLKIMAADNISEQKSPVWWTKILSEAAKELLKQDVEKGKVVARLEQDFPLSSATIRKYLPSEFKDPVKAEAGKAGGQAKSARSDLAEIPPPVVSTQYDRGVSAPKASDNRIAQHTPEAMILFNALARKFKCKTEESFERTGEYRCSKCQRTFSGPHLKDPPNCSKCSIPMQVKTFVVDVLVNDGIAVEVEGEGSSSKDNVERDKFLQEKGLLVLHIPNGAVRQYLQLCTDYVELAVRLHPTTPESMEDWRIWKHEQARHNRR